MLITRTWMRKGWNARSAWCAYCGIDRGAIATRLFIFPKRRRGKRKRDDQHLAVAVAATFGWSVERRWRESKTTEIYPLRYGLYIRPELYRWVQNLATCPLAHPLRHDLYNHTPTASKKRQNKKRTKSTGRRRGTRRSTESTINI